MKKNEIIGMIKLKTKIDFNPKTIQLQYRQKSKINSTIDIRIYHVLSILKNQKQTSIKQNHFHRIEPITYYVYHITSCLNRLKQKRKKTESIKMAVNLTD